MLRVPVARLGYAKAWPYGGNTINMTKSVDSLARLQSHEPHATSMIKNHPEDAVTKNKHQKQILQLSKTNQRCSGSASMDYTLYLYASTKL